MILKVVNAVATQLRDIYKVMTFHRWHAWLYIVSTVLWLVGLSLCRHHNYGKWISSDLVAIIALVCVACLCALHQLVILHIIYCKPFSPVHNLAHAVALCFPQVVDTIADACVPPEDASDRHVKMGTLRQTIAERLPSIQTALIGTWVVNLLFIAGVASVGIMMINAWLPSSFSTFTPPGGYIQFFYYTMATITTIGPSNIGSDGTVARLAIIYLNFTTLCVLTIGAGFMVNALFALPGRLRDDVDDLVGA